MNFSRRLPICMLQNQNDTYMQFTNPTIKQLEDLVVVLDHYGRENTEAINWILHTRKNLLNQEALKTQSELIPYISRFNSLLKEAVTKAYYKARDTYNALSECHGEGYDISVTAKCWISPSCPHNHPLYQEQACPFWEALCYPKYNDYYEDGITNTFIHFCKNHIPTLEDILYGNLDSKDNWNENLDPDLTKDLNIVYPFGRLFVLTSFALTDLIYVDEFSIDINAEISIDVFNE